MNKLAGFLEKYDTILFDMDGVITSEQNYWNSAALTVYEILNSKDYLGNTKIDAKYVTSNMEHIRKNVFCDDKLIEVLKKHGVNSNWDLAYIVIGLSVVLGTTDFTKVLEYEQKTTNTVLVQYENLARELSMKWGRDISHCMRAGRFWTQIHDCFQEWFLGDELYFKIYGRRPNKQGKPGLVHNEKPLVSLAYLQKLFSTLKESGKSIGIGTGRPKYEIQCPLKNWDILKYFSCDKIITYNHVYQAEARNEGMTLTKPNPFMFLKGIYGEDYPEEKLFAQCYDTIKIKKTLIVGDAGADILAAQAIGADFCAVLTGVSGHDMREYFKEKHATYICNSVEDFLEY